MPPKGRKAAAAKAEAAAAAKVEAPKVEAKVGDSVNGKQERGRRGAAAKAAAESAKAAEPVKAAEPAKVAEAPKVEAKAEDKATPAEAPKVEENGNSSQKKETPAAEKKGVKRKAEPEVKNGTAEPAEGEPKSKIKVKSSIAGGLADIDFSSSAKTQDGRTANFKIASWNVNGLRAWLEKDGLAYLKAEKPDVLCVQELKCDISKIPSEAQAEGYTTHWLSGDTEGYSGVGMYFKTKPIKITDGIGVEKHDKEGRVITAEFEKFYLVNTYIPNAGRGLVRLKYRSEEWDVDFRKYLKSLDQKKPVVWCGDLNVAHNEIDIKNPKGNVKNAGFTKEEREGFTTLLGEGYIDTFRHLHPEEKDAYTFWTYMGNARGKNVGWRLDYFVMSDRFKENLCDSVIRSKVMGSDHCPIVLHLAL